MFWKNSRSLILAATMAASLAAPAFAEEATPAYLVAQLNITDLQTYM